MDSEKAAVIVKESNPLDQFPSFEEWEALKRQVDALESTKVADPPYPLDVAERQALPGGLPEWSPPLSMPAQNPYWQSQNPLWYSSDFQRLASPNRIREQMEALARKIEDEKIRGQQAQDQLDKINFLKRFFGQM